MSNFKADNKEASAALRILETHRYLNTYSLLDLYYYKDNTLIFNVVKDNKIYDFELILTNNNYHKHCATNEVNFTIKKFLILLLSTTASR